MENFIDALDNCFENVMEGIWYFTDRVITIISYILRLFVFFGMLSIAGIFLFLVISIIL